MYVHACMCTCTIIHYILPKRESSSSSSYGGGDKGNSDSFCWLDSVG